MFANEYGSDVDVHPLVVVRVRWTFFICYEAKNRNAYFSPPCNTATKHMNELPRGLFERKQTVSRDTNPQLYPKDTIRNVSATSLTEAIQV